eukprot:276078_1
MWIQSALSCLLLVVLRAELDCKGIEIALQSGIVAMPMDVCRRVPETTTTAGYSTAYHCYDGEPVAAMYHNSNCTGTPEIYSLSDDDSDQPDEESDVDSDIDEGFTAYCDKPACNFVIYGVFELTACDQEPTLRYEHAYIADYCMASGIQYTCSGDNVVLKNYDSEDCTGNYTEVTYVDGAIECTEGWESAYATQATCGVASFTGPTTQPSESSSTNVVYHVYGMVWALFVYGMVYVSL